MLRTTLSHSEVEAQCIGRRGEEVSVSEICTATQIPRRTFYNCWNRYENGGLQNLNDKPRKPSTTHRTIKAVTYLRQVTGWCPHRIAGHVRKNAVEICHRTVYRILLREGLNNPLTKPRIKRTYRRWQRMHPNNLWQCDLKLVGAKWLIAILDDRSRFVTCSRIFNEGTAENVAWLLENTIITSPIEALITKHRDRSTSTSCPTCH